MAVWKYACKTMQGIGLDLKLLSGGSEPLKLTCARTGSGSVDPTQLVSLTEIIGPVQELPVLSAVECLEENKVRFPVILKNDGVEEAYSMRQLGIYAEDPDGGEVLYLVLQSEGAEEIPSGEEMKDFTLEWYLNVSVGNAGNVEVAIDRAGILTVEEGDARYMENVPGGSAGEFLKLDADGSVKWGPGSEVLWSGALFEGGSIEFDVPAYCIRDKHLSLVVEMFMVDGMNAKPALATLFFGSAKKGTSDDGNYYPYRADRFKGTIVRLRRCDVAGDEADDKATVLEIWGEEATVQTYNGYVDTHKVKAIHNERNTSNKKLVFTRISAYVPG